MKNTTRIMAAALCFAALTGGVTLSALADPVGSIRPAGKLKAADLPALTKVSFDTALKAALAQVPGSVIKAELEVEDGNLMYSFEIVGADKKTTEVEIDAGNGKVLGTENEDNEKKGGKEKD